MRDDHFGGDPACWSHLFDDVERTPAVIDLVALLTQGSDRGPIWSLATDELNTNLIRLGPSDNIAEHINTECDVLIIGIAGSGIVTIDGLGHPITATHLVLIPRGTNRSISPQETPFAYLTVHKRRPPLRPKVVRSDT
jgi:quercetin dioxygenase-like cupin family protein